MKSKLLIGGALLFIVVYASSCMVSHGGHYRDRGYRDHRNGRSHDGGHVHHYPRR